jgi:hypothetical protein
MLHAFWSAYRRVGRLGALAVVLVVGPEVVRAELLFEHHQGGPTEYREAGLNHAGEFQTTEGIRIEAVTGWFDGGGGLYGFDFEHGGFDGPPGQVGVSISASPLGSAVSHYSPSGPVDLFTTFTLSPLPPPPAGQLVPPGRWAGVGSLHWDLAPGTYSLNFLGAGMPLAYGYFGPVHAVAGFDGFYYNFRLSDEPSTDFPFGMRIYGRSLAAVPEPAAYGVVASLLLVLTVIGGRARPPRDELE